MRLSKNSIEFSSYSRGLVECLETRDLLAGDFAPGDSNKDYFFDEADFVQVAKFGKFESGESASWEEGDWNEDGLFNRNDLVLVFSQQLFRRGAYSPEATLPMNSLEPLSSEGAANVVLYYSPETGDLTAVSDSVMTALHLTSNSSSFRTLDQRLFGYTDPSGQFAIELLGSSTWIEHPGLLPTGWTHQQLMDDLLIDGAVMGGGGLGGVRLAESADLPIGQRPDDTHVTGPKEKPSFVPIDQASVVLTYDPITGDIQVDTLEDRLIFALELESPEGFFTGAVGREDQYTINAFDHVSPNVIHFQAADVVAGSIVYLDHYESFDLPGIAQTGLSEAEFKSGVYPIAVELFFDERGSSGLGVAFQLAEMDSCEQILRSGFTPGDANSDGVFDSTDLIAVFQVDEYEDDVVGNSTWAEGDWNCDGDFDTQDLIAAFQVGNYSLSEIAARATDQREHPASLPLSINGLRVPTVRSADQDSDRRPFALEYQWIDSIFDA